MTDVGNTSAFMRAAPLLAVVILAAAGSDVLAGSERHKWWWADDVRTEVGLTSQQSQEIDGIFESVRPRLKAGWDELDRLEQEVSRLMTEGATDESQISAAIDRVETARASLNKTRTLMLFRMYRVLSPDQRVKLRAVHDRRDNQRRQESSGQPR
jgi:Spy/CpxP family protein refolding chaperone